MLAVALVASFFTACKKEDDPEISGDGVGDLPVAWRFDGVSLGKFTQLDADKDGFTWVAYDGALGNGVISESFDPEAEEALNPNNYLLSPAVALGDKAVKLQWSVAATGKSYYKEFYQVYVSEESFTAENAAVNGVKVFEETLTEKESKTVAYREVDLSDWAGKKVYIAFVHTNCSEQDALMLADIYLSCEGADNSYGLPTIEDLFVTVPVDYKVISLDLKGVIGSDGGSNVVDCGFYVANKKTDEVETVYSYLTADNEAFGEITGLDPETEYVVSFFVKNRAGEEKLDFEIMTPTSKVYFEESFASEIPDTWTNIDKDGDGFKWEFLESSNGYKAAMSSSYDDGALTPENYLVSPAIEIPAGELPAELTYEIAATGYDYFEERYTVLISESPIDESNCRDAATLKEYSTIPIEASDAVFMTCSIDITSYRGKTVYIAFLHGDCTEMDALVLRNVAVGLAAE